MTELYSFTVCIALGMAARFLYLLASVIAKKTNVYPVTIALDVIAAAAVGGGFTLYIIMSGAVIAPYMFAAMLIGYFATYKLTRAA